MPLDESAVVGLLKAQLVWEESEMLMAKILAPDGAREVPEGGPAASERRGERYGFAPS